MPLIAADDALRHNDLGRFDAMSSAIDEEETQCSRTKSTLIGNVYPMKQGAIAFIHEDKTGVVLDLGFNPEGRPGSTAPDFSYGTWSYPFKEAQLIVEWGRTQSDAAAFRVLSDRPVTLEMTLLANPWRPFQHYFSSVEAGIDALAVTAGGEFIAWRLRTDPKPEQSDLTLSTHGAVSVKLVAGQTLRMAAGYGELPELARIDSILDAARSEYSRGRASAEGDWGNFAAAISDNLNNNRLYSSLTKKMANVVGRTGWLIEDPDYLPYFTWDTSFNALLASMEDPRTAMESIRTVLRYQLPNGMVSQLADWHGGQSGIVNMGNSNPPVTSLCAWKIYEHWGNRDFLAEVYPRLLKWHDWWPKHSDGNQNGLLEWGSTSGWKLALLSTGWDDTPHFDGSKMVGTQMNADAVDLNSLWSLDAEILGKMAGVLGFEKDMHRLEAEHREINRRINEELWNEELGLYCSRLWREDGKPGVFLERITPMNFYPLLCGAPDARKAESLLKTLTDPKKFWGDWPVPTLPYDDPEYFKQTYWKGHVWGPVNYLIWQGVKRYGSTRSQAELARRSVELFMRNWTAHGTCNENYFSTDGRGDDHPHYTWGALLCRIGIEALWEITVDGKPTGRQNSFFTECVELRNMPACGKLYRVSSKQGRVRITPELSVPPAWTV
jgi:hypothetical protein